MRIPLLEKYLIDKEFQYTYIIRSLLLLLFVMVSMAVVIVVWNQHRFFHNYLLYPPSYNQVEEWAKKNNVKTDSMQYEIQFLVQAKPYSFYSIIIYPSIIILLVNICVISIASLYTSYKLAIPLHELKIALRRKFETGQFEQPLKVRKGNPFHEITSLANLVLFIASHPGVKQFNDHE